MSDDPFLLDQAALEPKLRQLQENFERWRRIRDCRDVAEFVASADEFNWLCVELSQGIKNAGWDLDDLEETLKLMTESRQLAVSEAVQRTRRQFVANARQLLRQISSEVLPSTGRAAAASGRRGVGDSELLTAAGSSGNVVDHFAEEPANLDLLSPAAGGGGGGGAGDDCDSGYGGPARIPAWKRRLGAAVTFGPLRQMGLEDGGGGSGGGGCWGCLMRNRLRLLGAVVVAFLVSLLIAGIVVAARGNGGDGLALPNGTSIAAATTGIDALSTASTVAAST